MYFMLLYVILLYLGRRKLYGHRSCIEMMKEVIYIDEWLGILMKHLRK